MIFHTWMLLASLFWLIHGISSDARQLEGSIICPVSIFNPLELPICYIGDENSGFQNATEPSNIPHGTTSATPSEQSADSDLDTESPLDTANFLSFEDWKKQNLAKIGQSADNVGGKRQGGGMNQERRTQARAINNALDSFGDDAEIELNFGGFGSDNAENVQHEAWGSTASQDSSTVNADGAQNTKEDSAEGVSAVGRRKDAGTTCKERFNYASFDCAATILKTNPECSGSSSVLIENKDSYMLNECRAKDKFMILELCDDILIDTIVLANYEFFSSIFHTFRVSVSDRYPVKLDKWKELGVFKAQNTREVQAFAVEIPLIWARYVKIEFLTHYGNEFYCPLSLVRVHGTTMLEEYKNEGDSRAEEEAIDDDDAATSDPTEVIEEIPVVSENATVGSPDNATISTPFPVSDVLNETSPVRWNELEELILSHYILAAATCASGDHPVSTTQATPTQTEPSVSVATTGTDAAKNADTSTSETTITSEHVTEHAEHTNTSITAVPPPTENRNSTQAGAVPEPSTKNSTTSSRETSSVSSEATKTTQSNPPSPNPTTQESFFKSVNKRLQMLESNSSLSLLYIEEQSQILRDAFSKVEKRQMAKLNSFLENLNTTVIDEIKNLQNVYQSLRTVVLDDFENQQQEVSSTASQLAILTDELVFQKRMTAISSILIIVLFGLILIPRGAGTVGIDLHSMIAWSPRPSSSPKTPKVSSTKASTPSVGSERKMLRKMLHKHPKTEDTECDINDLPPAPVDDIQIKGYEGNGRFRSLSELSEVERNKIFYPSFPQDLRHMLGYDSLRTRFTPGLMKRFSSSAVEQTRPVSSPPVLTPVLKRTDLYADNESDTSTEPFPPFPTQ
ncbi:UNC-like C-terminal-domain-containing protein [Talaromyces proteolyticus]|uniref:UNC-like C-terminal-domain-containing protein n=1 Tax=Talaromyces proteolyticus TaxID=1131652 RepID=A0AAD4KYD7_9EURO|nr:UNC-like C-terminal-domain-containing protein [Talaromyces proteolyticus]KAH8702520.1 UNC-like C-terminal-domain-containing protein [Talaromyces proteolyticus]